MAYVEAAIIAAGGKPKVTLKKNRHAVGRAVRQCLSFLAKADKVSVVLGYFAHDIGEIGLD